MLTNEGMEQRIFDGMLRGVGRGERDGDDEIGGGETDEHHNEEFPPPTGEQIFQHGDGTLAGVGTLRDLGINWQGAEQCNQHENGCSYRGEGSGSKQGNARLVSKGGKIINAGEPKHSMPRVRTVILMIGIKVLTGC